MKTLAMLLLLICFSNEIALRARSDSISMCLNKGLMAISGRRGSSLDGAFLCGPPFENPINPCLNLGMMAIRTTYVGNPLCGGSLLAGDPQDNCFKNGMGKLYRFPSPYDTQYYCGGFFY